MHSDVLIIGGGVGGLSCAITLASAKHKPWFGNRTITVLDRGQSDLHKAVLNNAPGIGAGTCGSDVLDQMRDQFQNFGVGKVHQAQVTALAREPWTAQCANGQAFEATHLVLATGYKQCDIEGLPWDTVLHHPDGKPSRIAIPHDGVYCIDANAYVAGLLAGGSSQFAIASGIGAQVAVELLCQWAEKRTHVHDTAPGTP